LFAELDSVAAGGLPALQQQQQRQQQRPTAAAAARRAPTREQALSTVQDVIASVIGHSVRFCLFACFSHTVLSKFHRQHSLTHTKTTPTPTKNRSRPTRR
jgi:hypothetical protein